jgi:hypothetical protein
MARNILQRSPKAICEAHANNVQTTLQINQEKAPTDNPVPAENYIRQYDDEVRREAAR